MARLGEIAFIADYLAPLASHPAAFGLQDDAALLTALPDHGLVITADALVAGVHFFEDDDPGDAAYKALATNVSDLPRSRQAPGVHADAGAGRSPDARLGGAFRKRPVPRSKRVRHRSFGRRHRDRARLLVDVRDRFRRSPCSRAHHSQRRRARRLSLCQWNARRRGARPQASAREGGLHAGLIA